MSYNSKCIERLGLGWDLGFELNEKIIVQKIQELFNSRNYEETRSRIQSIRKDGINIASDWIFDRINNL